jgi:UDP-3-O-[3-hydroxymyristoyl] glucosamine N-acyltransferase
MISKLAVVETSDIGENTRIAEFAVIRQGARIGANVVIPPSDLMPSFTMM